jgi:3-hydroxyisobutyrate dehydrogenase-like beta-hydroxyacid dehydrogenase
MTTIGLISPGEMGHAIGAVLKHHGARVITNLSGRGEKTAERAARAGIIDVKDDVMLVTEADMLLSVLAPALATDIAERIVQALDTSGSSLLYVDCNAIAPHTVRPIETLLTEAGSRFADVGIVGGPPAIDGPDPRLYASGPGASEFANLRDFGLDIRVIGPDTGQASGLKMCYGGLTKGLNALATEILTAGQALGLEQALVDELKSSQAALLAWMERQIPTMPPKSARWVGEMEEVASTFEVLGLPPQIHQGAAALFQWIADVKPNGDLGPKASVWRTAGEITGDLSGRLTHE